jgi:signal recognition particle receptor subunit beta
MVQINFAQKTVNVKIVYYGPGMSGKTTNLEVIHQRAPQGNRGDLTSISTDGDRTLFFDYMPLDLGTVAGMRTAFQLYTVPGQVYYNSTRKLVLQGVDGVIFVADSSASMVNQNLESLRNLEENLNEYGKSLATLPHVIQYNKRDLPDALSVDELAQAMNKHRAPHFEAVANTGQGVFPTLKALAASVLKNIMNESGSKAGFGGPAPTPAPPPPPPRQKLDVSPPAGHGFPPPQQPMAQPGAPFPQHGAHAGHGHQPQGGGHGFAPPQGGGGFGAPQHQHPPAQHAPPPQYPQQSGLQLAQPMAHPMAAQPLATQQPLGGGELGAPAPRPASAARASRPAAASRPRSGSRPAAKEAPKAKSKLGPILVTAGAGVGALLAWVLLKVL